MLSAVWSHRRAIGRELAIAAGFVAAAIAMTWPLALHLSTAVHDPTDPLVSASILEWDLHALTHHPLQLFDQPIFHPAHDALAFTEHLFGIALAVLPFYLFGASPIALHSFAVILGFAFCGYAATLLGRTVTGSTAAGLAGGVCYAFVPYRFHHVTHVSYVWAGWLPLLLAALVWYVRRPTWPRASFFAVVFFMNGITCLHWLAFGSIAVAAAALLVAAASGNIRRIRWWAPIASATALACIALLPWLVPYRTVAHDYGMQRSWAETKAYSGRWIDWLTPPRESRLYGQLVPDEAYIPEHPLFPGAAVLLLASAALLLTRSGDLPDDGFPDTGSARPARWIHGIDAAVAISLALAAFVVAHGPVDWSVGRVTLIGVQTTAVPLFLACALIIVRLWIALPAALGPDSLGARIRHSRFSIAVHCALLWIVLGVAGSFGVDGFFHATLFTLLPPIRGIRVPLRWAMVTYVGLSVLAAVGMLTLLRRIRGKRAWAVTAVVIAAVMLESSAPIPWMSLVTRPLPVDTWLAGVRLRGAVAELPMNERFSEYSYLLGQTVHHQALINGVSSFVPARYGALADISRKDPIPPAFIDSLGALGCSLIVVHTDDLFEHRPAVRRWLSDELSRGRLTFVRRFDHGILGDYVFAITRNEPGAAQWQEPERPDISGRTPRQTLAVFLQEDGFTYNHDTFGSLSIPAWGHDMRGTVGVMGMAMSPFGVHEVNVLLDQGRLRAKAVLSDSPAIRSRTPWYPQAGGPLFTASVPVPRGKHGITDIQIEIVDSRGESTLLEDIPFRWSDLRALDPADWNREAMEGLLRRAGVDPVIALTAILQRRTTVADIGDQLVAESKGRTDQEFITRVYEVLFDHPADSRTARRWSEKLARGVWRRDMVDTLLDSEEFGRTYLRPGAVMEPLR